ncbi:MAG: hypothetical protein P8P49_04525 [Opitutales bacterium]|nr:hypothetical protein [Opitutales bacterium]
MINASGECTESRLFAGIDSPAPAGSIPATSTKVPKALWGDRYLFVLRYTIYTRPPFGRPYSFLPKNMTAMPRNLRLNSRLRLGLDS